MVKQDRYYGVDRYLPHAVVATTAVVALPAMVVVALLVALDGQLAPLLAAVVGAALALTFAGIGSLIWSHTSGALDIAFSELLIWGWMRRKKAEESAARNARLLGLDDDGRPEIRAKSAHAQQLTILGDLSSALESKDPYTHGHSQRVERHALRAAAHLDMSIEDIAQLRRAAALHDVGKIRVPHRILRKPGSLTPEERRIIEQHTVVGAWLVSNVCKRDIVLAVRHHHERWDGRGYPDGLAGEEIPMYARIIAVADAFDAMTSTRPYRAAYDSRTAIEILEAEAGAQFDPAVVRAFVESVPSQLPIAAFLPLFGAGLFRKLRDSAQRTFKGTASGAVTAGAASILIAALLTPIQAPLAGPERPSEPPHSVTGPATPGGVLADGMSEDASVRLKSKDNSKTKYAEAGALKKSDAKMMRAKGSNKSKKKNADSVVLSDKLSRKSGGGGSSGGGANGPVSSGGSSGGNDGGTGGTGGTDGGNNAGGKGGGSGGGNSGGGNDGGNNAGGTTKPDPKPASGHQPPGDPQPNRGKDCPPKPGKKSPGRHKHCS